MGVQKNKKSVSGTGNNVGGIIGSQMIMGSSSNSYSSCTISNCSNSGNVTGSSYVGGIIGNGQCTKKDENIWASNSNSGTISGSNKGDK